MVPVPHIYGRREIEQILGQSRARVAIIAERFGRQDFVLNLDAIWHHLPDLELVVVVGARFDITTRMISWERLIGRSRAVTAPAQVAPDQPAIIGYTSGTTAAPKGVVHTHRSMLAETRQWRALHDEDTSPPRAANRGSLYGSPISHITGLLGVLSPLEEATAIHLVDTWRSEEVLQTLVRDRLLLAPGASYFLSSLLDDATFVPDVHLPYISRVALGGAPVSPALVRRARDAGISIVRAYGSTEHPGTTGSVHSDPEAKRLYTDGRCAPGVELRLTDESGRQVAPGQPGLIHSRGPELFAGYVDTSLPAVDADGWYCTGDIGVIDTDGYLTVTDRQKDIIIRGGENVSAAEVEEILSNMVEIAEVAVVAAPDDKYGEHGCAVVRLAPTAQPFDLPRLVEPLADAGLARQKWPEEMRFVDEFPRTASGKIQKQVLRDMLRDKTFQ
jgi:acyl-CoA synthetase (AMP-forming)/AMP-acid ligase II